MTSAAKPKPILTAGESRAYPVLPLRDIVVFPHMIVPLFVGREKSIKALEEVMRSRRRRTPPMTSPQPTPSFPSARSQACCNCSSCPMAP
jgi:ATP-dependent Lon protease